MTRYLTLALAVAVLFAMAGGASALPDDPLPDPGEDCTVDNCVLCTVPDRCQRCLPRFWRIGGKCRACPSTCKACKNVGGKPYCTACQPGYVLERKISGWAVGFTGKCIPPPSPACALPRWTRRGWQNVVGRTDDGSCVKCTPQGPYARFCMACDGDSPHVCTKCNSRRPWLRLKPNAQGICVRY